MNHTIATIAAVSSMICILTGGVNAGMGENLVKNPSLAEGAFNWNLQTPWHNVVDNEGRTDKHSIYTNVIAGKTPYSICGQSVPLKGGKYYMFGAWVKTRGISGKPTFCIEWASKNGYMGGSYVHEWPIKLEGDNDWQKITYASQRLPDEAVGGNIILVAPPGEMWWDDFELFEMDAPAFKLEYADPVWHGVTILDSVKQPEIRFKLTKNPEVKLPFKKVNVRASLYEVDDKPPVSSIEIKNVGDEGADVVIPADNMPLGTGVFRLEAVDAESGWTVFKEDINIEKIEWIGLDIVEPSTMGVVGTTPDQPLKLKCRLRCSVPKGAEIESYNAVLTLTTTKGQPVSVPPVVVKIKTGETKYVVFPMDKAPLGHYFLEVAIKRPGSDDKLAVSRRLVSRVDPNSKPKNAVDILPNGLLKVDGKPFFPFGVYALSSLKSLYPADAPWQFSDRQNPELYEPLLEMIGKSPLNCVLDYGGNYKQPLTNVEDMKKFLDKAQQSGVKVIYNVKDNILNSVGTPAVNQDNDKLLGEILPNYIKHPALLGTYLSDEAGYPEMREPREAAQIVARRLDPWHPTYNVEFNFPHSKSYAKLTDAYGTDPYLIMGDIGMCAKSWKTAKTSMPSGQPMWAVLQIFGAGYETSNPKDTREPTYDEMRCGAFTAITEGATGIICYAIYSMQRSPEFPRRWKELCSIADEVQKLVPIIGLPDAKSQVKVIKGNVSIRSKGGDGKIYTFLTNTDRNPKTITLRWPVNTSKVSDKLSRKNFEVKHNVCEIEMPALGVMVLEVDSER